MMKIRIHFIYIHIYNCSIIIKNTIKYVNCVKYIKCIYIFFTLYYVFSTFRTENDTTKRCVCHCQSLILGNLSIELSPCILYEKLEIKPQLPKLSKYVLY